MHKQVPRDDVESALRKFLSKAGNIVIGRSVRIRNRLVALINDESGGVAITFAMALVPILIGVGSALDLGRAYHTRSLMQNSADAAVLAAALSGDENDAMKRLAENGFAANLDGQFAVEFASTPAVDVDISNGIITLKAGASVKTTLLGIIRESVDIGVLSRARLVQGGPACIVSLDPSTESGLRLAGTADVIAKDCGIQVNSDHDNSITQLGGADADVPHICTRGGFTGTLSTKPKQCPILVDPVRDLVVQGIEEEKPRLGTRSPTVKNKKNDVTLSPGLYRGTLRVQSNASLILEPGLYFIENGDFEVWANSTVRGDEVTIIFTGNQAGGVQIRAGSDVELTAPRSGPFRGLLFVQDPNAKPRNDESILIGGGTLELTGTIYLPLHELTITGNGSISAESPQFAIIANKVTLEGNGQLNINMDTDYQAAGYEELPGVTSPVSVILLE